MIRSQRVDTSVTLTHISALVTLRQHGPMNPSELATRERVQPPTMTRILATLESHGLTVRSAHPVDRRQTIIALSAAGRDLLRSERRARDAWLARRLSQLTPDERARLDAVIPLLEKLAGG
jgi:DNA-binding MarR family transcriptional regulator